MRRPYFLRTAPARGKTAHVDYHIEFFAAGITAMIKKWLGGGCKESPEEMLEILMAEYGR